MNSQDLLSRKNKEKMKQQTVRRGQNVKFYVKDFM